MKLHVEDVAHQHLQASSVNGGDAGAFHHQPVFNWGVPAAEESKGGALLKLGNNGSSIKEAL